MAAMTQQQPSTIAICANIGGVTIDGIFPPCVNPATNACKGCLLVQYCSRECQHSHWHVHKADCRSPLRKSTWKPGWDVQARAPAFLAEDDVYASILAPETWAVPFGGSQPLLTDIPAIDLLNLSKNEGFNKRVFRLLFAASGDPRSLIKTVASFPNSYSGQVDAIMNDKDFEVVARNAILLLAALHFGPGEAVPIMIHLWYSALIPAGIVQSLREHILPLIQRVCKEIRAKPVGSLQSKTWKFGANRLRLVLQKEEWNRLLSFFEVPPSLSKDLARKIRTKVTLAPERVDYLHRTLNTQSPSHRLCTMKFREDGILLPFASSRAEFDTPNPTFYHANEPWPTEESSDPLRGWPNSEVLQKASLAKNDIYGSLFLYIQDILWKFCTHLSRVKLNLELFRLNALELPTISGIERNTFDRIDVFNLADNKHTGLLWTLNTYAPYLQTPSQNPHATILALFSDVITETVIFQNATGSNMAELKRLVPYLSPTPDMWWRNNQRNGDLMRFLDGISMMQDYDRYWDRETQQTDFKGVVARAGLVVKKAHTLVEKWPLRVRIGAEKAEFDHLLSLSRDGSQRYVEWTRLA